MKIKTDNVSIPHRYGTTGNKMKNFTFLQQGVNSSQVRYNCSDERAKAIDDFVSIPHRYGTTKMNEVISADINECQFLIGTVQQQYLLCFCSHYIPKTP